MSWQLQGKWPVETGDEITASCFEDIRRLMFSIRNYLLPGWSEYSLPDPWERDKVYTRGAQCSYDGRPYGMRAARWHGGDPPPQNGAWRLLARPDVYCDYNLNSGCYIYATSGAEHYWWPASLELPPQFNKYTQRRVIDPAGQEVPAEQLYGKGQEYPVEIANALITGPIGARYTEWHTVENSGPFAPPHYYPYHVVGGRPWGDHPRGDPKLTGYQSYIEAFIEKRGWELVWEIEGVSLEDVIVNDNKWYYPLMDRVGDCLSSPAYDSHWGCNWSAFEKCLQIIDSRSSESRCDWYLVFMISCLEFGQQARDG